MALGKNGSNSHVALEIEAPASKNVDNHNDTRDNNAVEITKNVFAVWKVFFSLMKNVELLAD